MKFSKPNRSWLARIVLNRAVAGVSLHLQQNAFTRLHPQGKGGPKGADSKWMKKNWICIISKVITFWIPQTPFIAPETFKIWLQNRSETKKRSLFGSSKLHLSLLKRSKSWSKTGQKLKKWDIFGPDFERFRNDKWRLRVRKWVKVIIPLLWLRTDMTWHDRTDRHTDAQTFLDSYTIGPSGNETSNNMND